MLRVFLAMKYGARIRNLLIFIEVYYRAGFLCVFRDLSRCCCCRVIWFLHDLKRGVFRFSLFSGQPWIESNCFVLLEVELFPFLLLRFAQNEMFCCNLGADVFSGQRVQ